YTLTLFANRLSREAGEVYKGDGRLRRAATLLHGSAGWTQYSRAYSVLCDADVARSSQLQHAVQDVDSNCHLCCLTLVGLRAQRVTDDPFQRPTSASTKARQLYPDAFCQPMRPCSAITFRCRSRGVGAVTAVGLGTAFDRGGTMTTAPARHPDGCLWPR